jgi:glutathione S-transferase
MKLIGSLTSPFVRKVRIVLAEKAIGCEFLLDVPWSPDTHVPEFNPLGKVPVLVLDDGSTLFDSRVIVEYLDALSANAPMLPADPKERIRAKRWEALADGICDAAATALMESRRPEGEKSPGWIVRQRGKVDLGLQALAKDLGDRAWCGGQSMDLADIACGCCLGYLVFRFPDIDWRSRHANLAALYDKLMARQSFIDSVPHD